MKALEIIAIACAVLMATFAGIEKDVTECLAWTGIGIINALNTFKD